MRTSDATRDDEHSAPALHMAALEGGERAAGLLRGAGCRPTPQRLMVLRALGPGGHVTAEEVLALVRREFPAVNPSTVYRALETLTDAGLVRPTDLGAGRMHFELARGHRHHHVVCGDCGAVRHLHDDVLGPLLTGVTAATGFTVPPEREVVLHGRCARCASHTPEGARHAHP